MVLSMDSTKQKYRSIYTTFMTFSTRINPHLLQREHGAKIINDFN